MNLDEMEQLVKIKTIELKNNMIKELKNNICTVTFTKKDGTERVMNCTLQQELLPITEEKEVTKKKVINPDILAVYEIDNGWHSFRIDSVTSFVIKVMGE